MNWILYEEISDYMKQHMKTFPYECSVKNSIFRKIISTGY